MLLNEILDKSSAPIKWAYQGKYEAVALFDTKSPTSEGRVYAVLFHADGTDTTSWSVMFGDKNKQTGELNLINDTNEFDASTVFVSIKTILKQFIEHYKPTEFTFSGTNKRVNLYLKLFRKFLPNCKISEENGLYMVKLGE